MNKLMKKALMEDLYVEISCFLLEKEVDIGIDMKSFVSEEKGKGIRTSLKSYLYNMASEDADMWISRIESIENIKVE